MRAVLLNGYIEQRERTFPKNRIKMSKLQRKISTAGNSKSEIYVNRKTYRDGLNCS